MSNRAKILLKVVLTAALLVFLLARMDLTEFANVLISADPLLVLIAGLFYFGTVFLSVGRWKAILENFDIHTPLVPLTQICLIGYFFNLFLPSAIGGDFVRGYYLAKRESRGMSTTLTSTLLDRTAGLSALLLIGLISVSIYPISVEGFSLLGLFLLVGVGFAIGITAIFHSGVHRHFSALLKRLHLDRFEEKLELVYQGLTQLRRNRFAILLVVFLSLGVQLLVVIAMWFAAQSIGVGVSFNLFLIFIPIVNLATAIPLTINGVGVRESVYYLLFSQVGVPVESAVTLSLLNLVIMMMAALPGGIVYSLYKKEQQFSLDVEP
jgi:uncharacterized protein (TIRG00374 family)